MAVAMVAVGLASFALPRCFAGVAGYFARSSAGLNQEERERLNRVIAAREDAEGISSAYGRYLGITALALAGLEALRPVPAILPYALFCLASAVVALLAYMQFRRATEQRVAPLVRRSPLAALPPLIIGAVGSSFLVSAAVAAYGPERLGAFVVAVSTAVLGVIAWRIANAPALLIGIDPQFEYMVDERVRIGRARSVAALACATAFVLVGIADPSLSELYGPLGSAAVLIVTAAFVISLAASIVPLRQRIRVA